MNTISPKEALRGREYAVVNSKTNEVYDLYPDSDVAGRIANDLCKRYGEGSYYAAHIEVGD